MQKISTLLLGASLLLAQDVAHMSFTPLSLPDAPVEATQVRLSSALITTDTTGKEEKYPLRYVPLLSSGDTVAGSTHAFGAVLDAKGAALTSNDGSVWISNGQDANTLIYDGNATYLLTHFENRIGAITQTTLTLKEGAIVPTAITPIDFSSIRGISNVCAGSRAPWNAHLGGEESSADALLADPASPFYVDCALAKNQGEGYCALSMTMQRYLGKSEKFNAHRYGYIVEATVEKGEPKVARHYVSGKYTPEMAIVMEDNRTMYISDDGGDNGFYKLVLDEAVTHFTPRWKGTLYAAKFTPTDGVMGYDVAWIALGQGDDATIEALIERRPVTSDFFELSLTPKKGMRKIVEDGYTYYMRPKTLGESKRIHTQAELELGRAFLESRKWAAYLGASINLKKEEGIAYDPKGHRIFLALSKIDGNNCGAVYAMPLDKTYSATRMEAIAVGEVLTPSHPDYARYGDRYACHPDKVANPDNIAFVGYDTLMIGEDTSSHYVNMLWAYNTRDKSLTRVATLPTGGEVTGISAGNVEGKSVLFFNIQHPMGDVCKAANKASGCNADIIEQSRPEDERGVVGYIDGLPSKLY
ncbi:MAG: hypothetical protein KU37_03400 [Sulfuricurvum sp. PC08-66]|nr:MAG: hypothetical protein KU37_03400 [Sulfuricurvum sp. PC08-66]